MENTRSSWTPVICNFKNCVNQCFGSVSFWYGSVSWNNWSGSGSWSESDLKSRKYPLFFLLKIYFAKKWFLLLFMGLIFMFVKHKFNIFEKKNVWYSYDFGWFLWTFYDFGWFLWKFHDFGRFFATRIRNTAVNDCKRYTMVKAINKRWWWLCNLEGWCHHRSKPMMKSGSSSISTCSALGFFLSYLVTLQQGDYMIIIHWMFYSLYTPGMQLLKSLEFFFSCEKSINIART